MYPRPKRIAAGLCAFAVLILVALPGRDRFAPVPAPPHPQFGDDAHEDAGYDNPDQFLAYHAAIRGPGYPPNYRMEAFNKTVAARKQPGKKLDWVERGPANVPGRTRAVVVDPDDPTHRTWFAGSVSGGLWKTEDGGVSWQSLTDHLPNLAVSALAMAPSHPDVIYMGTGEGFSHGIGHVQGSGIFRSADRGRTWTQLESTVRGPAFRYVNRLLVDPDNAQTVVAATNEGIYRTTDGGGAWDQVYSAPDLYERVQDLKASPDDFEIQYAAVSLVAILRSTDAGRTWQVSLDDFAGGEVGRMELAITPSSPGVVYASASAAFGNDRLYRTVDRGDTWNPVQIDGPTDWLRYQGWYNQTLAVHPFDVDRVLLGGVLLVEASVGPGIRERRYVSELTLRGFGVPLVLDQIGGNSARGEIQTGDELAEVLDVGPSDLVSIEIQFGPGRSQKAHRYTVSGTGNPQESPPDGNNLDRPFAEYEYQDYTDVPFEVWDIENNRQLTVSFRDQARNGRFSPGARTNPNPCRGCGRISWEVVAIHGYPYDESSADGRLAQDGGLVHKLLYYLIPYVTYGQMWDPENLPETSWRLSVAHADFLMGETSWHPATTNRLVHVDHHNLIYIPVDEDRGEFKLLNANDGGVYFSEDSGQTFTGATGYNTTQFYGLAKKPGEYVYIGGTQDNGTWLSGPDPRSDALWVAVLGGDGFQAVWHAVDVQLVLASSQGNRIARSTDGGMTFRDVETPERRGPFVTQLANSKDAPDRVFAIGLSGVWKSEDFGMSWQVIQIPEEHWGYFAGRIRVSIANADVVWAGGALNRNFGTVVVSLDGGETFAPTAVPDFSPESAISGLATHPRQDSASYVLFSASGQPKILHTSDLGQSWRDLSGFADSPTGESTNGFPDVAVYDLLVMPHDPDILWAGTEIGLFESTDGGEHWEYADNGLPAVSVWQMTLVDDQVILATHGRGIWTLDTPSLVAGEGFEELPAAFSLGQNYPNPFNPETTIAFNLASDEPVTLTVFDVLGRRVAVLLDRKEMTRGSHAVQFDGQALASGVYFYQLRAGDAFHASKRMTLVR